MKKFYNLCYGKLRKVPRGKVTTYKEIARSLNSKAYRAVGTAMNKNPHAYNFATFVGGNEKSRRSGLRGDSKRTDGFFLVPCHRVINSDGRVGKFADGTKKKIAMLRREGVEVINGRVDLDKYFFKF
jgi:methylated-DNA-[protein]-cysteine S-methyltransferase